jgi:hypothetical protein
MPKVFEAPPGFVLNPDYLVPELRAQRDALLEALRPFVTIGSGFDMEDVRKARAAIAKAEEGK